MLIFQNHTMRNKLLIILFLLATFAAAGQQDNKSSSEQLADYRYNNAEYEIAIELYETLYEKTNNKYYYQQILNSYLALKSYKDAERHVESRIKKDSRDLTLLVDLGNIYEVKGDKKKAEKSYEKAIDKITMDMKTTEALANAFDKANHQEYAAKTYLAFRKKTGNRFVFISEMAAVYARQGDYNAMTQEYLDLLDRSPGSINYVQVSLSRSMQQTSDEQLAAGVRQALIERIDAQPNNKVYLEMMIWYSLQVKDFEFAMQQAIAVDARFPELGTEQIYKVAGISLSNKEYDVARQCYQAIIDKGKETPHYMDSRIGVLKVQFEPLSRNFPLDKKQLDNLCYQYQQTFVDLGKTASTATIMRDFAHILAYYVGNAQAASDMLYDIMDIPKLSNKTKDEVKLDLADLLLYAGDVWEASLMYMQVEKANKDDVLGARAKFKNATLAYYNHDFTWAKSQLEVLRASTTKLIANDAMQLSLLISDNLDPENDDDIAMMEYYADAELYVYRNMFDTAWTKLEEIEHRSLNHPLLDEVLMQKAHIRMRQMRYHEADSLLQKIAEQYPDDILADDALMLRAQLAEDKINNAELAKECYEKILLDYPVSLYVDQARKRYNELKKIK